MPPRSIPTPPRRAAPTPRGAAGDRLRHALRFAVTTGVAVLALGVLWEVVTVYGRGIVALGRTADETFRLNAATWWTIALAMAGAVFLLRLGDLVARPPSWRFAWALAAYEGVATVFVTHLVGIGRIRTAAALAVLLVAVWFLVHRRIPGWPGARAPVGTPDGETLSPGRTRPDRELRSP